MITAIACRLRRIYGRLTPGGAFLLSASGIGLFCLLGYIQTPSDNTTPVKAAVPVALSPYDPVAKWGQPAVTAAQKVIAIAKHDGAIYEEGFHLVVEMKMYVADDDQRLQYVRSIADSDLILHGSPRNIYFYDPSHRKIAQADRMNGVRLAE